MLFEDGAIEVGFLGQRGVDREAERGRFKHLVAHFVFNMHLQAIDPGVAHAIGELLLLTPCHFLRQVVLKGLTQQVLLDLAVATHLVLRIEAHGHIHELLVQEGYTAFHAPSRHGLVGTQAVIHVQLGELTHCLFVKLLGIRSLMEIEVATEQLIGAFTGEHHLDAHGLDVASHQVHGGRGTNRRDVVGFQVIDHITQRIQTLLHREGDLMVDGLQMVGDFLRGGQIR